MDYRATEEEILAYTEKFTEENFVKIFGEDVERVIHSTGFDNEVMSNALSAAWVSVRDDTAHTQLEEDSHFFGEGDLYTYSDNFWKSPEGGISKEEKVVAAKQMLRNLVFSYGKMELLREYDIAVLSDYDIKRGTAFKLEARVTHNDGAFSGKVDLFCETDDSKEEIFTIPPVKMTKFLRKIGMTEQFVTRFSLTYSNKPKSYEIYITDKYIPEHYQMLAKVEDLTSCMSKPSHFYDLPKDEHPTLAYEDSDCLLMLVKEVGKEGYPYVARSIINRETGKYVRIYGNTVAASVVKHTLSEGDLYDCRINRIESANGGHLLPYLDSDTSTVSADEAHWVIDGGGISCDYESGRSDDDISWCDCCQSNTTDVMEDTEEDGRVCQRCFNEYYRADHRGRYYLVEELNWSEYNSEYYTDGDCFFSDLVEDYLYAEDDEKVVAKELGIEVDEED